MSIYTDLFNSINNGKKFTINLKSKNLKIGVKEIIKEGELITDNELIEVGDLKNIGFEEKENSWDNLKTLYHEFKYSIPSEKYKNNSYFKALKVEDMTLAELSIAKDRYLCQGMLEGYILLASMGNLFEWQNKNDWFWQDENEKDLIILREWIERR